MWMLLRVLALAVLALIGLLIVGRGGWLLDGVDAALALAGAEDVPRAGAIPSPVATIGGLSLGIVAAVTTPVHRVVGQLVTLLHELGHTVVAAALGARPAGVVLRHDASGHATARWTREATPLRRLALAAVAFAGLPAAAAVAAAGAQLLLLTGPRSVLWGVAVAGVVVGLLARSAWSLLIALAVAGLALAALREAVEPWAVGVVIGLLTATAVKTARDSAWAARRPIQRGDDARAVGGALVLPPRLVQLGQIALTAALSGWTLWLLARGLTSGG
jgi:hypothetical protein